MAIEGRYRPSNLKQSTNGASAVIGNLIAIMIVILIAGIAFYYFLNFHVADSPDITAYSVTAQNASAMKITCMAGNSIPTGSVSMLLNNTRISNFGLADANRNGRWDPGEIASVSGVDIASPRLLTITSNSYVLYTATVQYLGAASGSAAAIPVYASGVTATYFSDESWKTQAATGIATVINYADDSGVSGGYSTAESHWPTAKLGKDEQFSVDFSGLVKIDQEADYTFYLTSDDGSWLTVDGTQVVNNGGLHSPTEKKGTIHLAPGYHDLDVKMYEHTGTAVVHLEYSSPTLARQYVQALYHIPRGKPAADFTGSPRGAPAPLQVKFTDRSADATVWHWDFGDGSTSAEQNPTHTYAAAGKYTVALAATNAQGTDTKTVPDYILAGGGAPGFLVTYYTDEAWITAAGTETLSELKLADAAGASAGNPSDKASWPKYSIGKDEGFSTQAEGSLLVGAEADYTFYLTSDDGSWLTVDGTQVVNNGGLHSAAEKQGTIHLAPGYHDLDVKMYEHTGVAVLRLEYSSPTMARQYVQSVYHVPVALPAADFTASPHFAPAHAAIQFTDASKDAVSWSWDFGDGKTSTEQNPAHTYAAAGTYTVKLTATNDVGSNTKTATGLITVGTGTQGFQATYYSDEAWTTAASTETLSEIQLADASGIGTGYASDKLNWPKYIIGKDEGFSVRFTGSLKIDSEADYTFYLTSDDGSWLTVDGTQAIDNGGLHSATLKQATVHLKPGYHDLDVKMYEHTGQAIVRLEYSSPTMVRQFVQNVYSA